MGKNTFATPADLAALHSYSERQRIAVLSCYLLDPKEYTMQDVAEIILGDNGSQAGQRVSLITRCYGFSARNAGRYCGQAEEQDIRDFVRQYQPERTASGLAEGSFDSFLQPRLAERRRREQEQRRIAQQRQLEEQRRQQEQRRIAQQRQLEELRRQQEQQRQREELRRQEEELRRQQEEQRQKLVIWREQEQKKRAQAQQIAEEAAALWRQPNATLEDMERGIMRYREARKESWQEYDEASGQYTTYEIGVSEEYLNTCASAAELASQDRRGYAMALGLCICLCDEGTVQGIDRTADPARYRKALPKSPHVAAIGRGFQVRTRICLDRQGAYYNPNSAAEFAHLGARCGVPFCMLRFAECLETGLGMTKKNVQVAYQWYEKLQEFPEYGALAEEKLAKLRPKILTGNALQVFRFLNRQAPDALPMVGYEMLEWDAYRQNVLQFPKLWGLYQKANSAVSVSGLIFKKTEETYVGELSEEDFAACCQEIWKVRRVRYDLNDYEPCPAELARIDELFQTGMEQYRLEEYEKAQSQLRLPAMNGNLQAQKAIAEIYQKHIPNPELLLRALDLLTTAEDEAVLEFVVERYASLEHWDKALAVCQRIKDVQRRGELAWKLGNLCSEHNQQFACWMEAAECGHGQACYSVALQGTSRELPREAIIGWLERAETCGALWDREILARQYASGPEEKRDYLRAAKQYLCMDVEEIMDWKQCVYACDQAISALLKKKEHSEEEEKTMAGCYQMILQLGTNRQRAWAKAGLAKCYQLGKGVTKDKATAKKLLYTSAQEGYPFACCTIAKIFLESGNPEKALAIIQKRFEDTPDCVELQKKIEEVLKHPDETC